MDLELLRTFLEVNRTRHFGQAADALSLTQAAVSARIKQLEGLLGVILFDRSRREIQLTPEGGRLLRYADMLIMGWRKARQDVTLGGADHQLALGGSFRLWDVLLSEWLLSLRQSQSDLAIISESNSPEMLLRHLLDGVMDVAFMLEPPQLEQLEVQEIALIRLVMVSTKAGVLADEALAGNYLMVDWGFAHALQHRRLFPDAPEPQVRIALAGVALNHLQSLDGAAYLPTRLVTAALEAGWLHLVTDAPPIDHHAYAVFPVRSQRKPLIKKVLRLFEHHMPLDGEVA